MENPGGRDRDFDWEAIVPQKNQLTSLEEPIFEQEVLNALDLMPADKAPGPNGFTRGFRLIKNTLIGVVDQKL